MLLVGPPRQSGSRLEFFARGQMRGWRDSIPGLALATELTIIIVVSVLFPLILGILLDRLLQTMPLITLAMVVLGTALGTIAVYRQVSAEIARIVGGKK